MVIVWSDALLRYPELAKLPDTSSASQVQMINMAEGRVGSRLSGQYSVPFSSNNITAQDLTIDAIYIQTQMTRQPDRAKALRDDWNERVDALLSGAGEMVTEDGTIAGTVVGDPVWSSTQDYHPTFGMGDPMTWEVSSSQAIDEDNARGHYPGDSA